MVNMQRTAEAWSLTATLANRSVASKRSIANSAPLITIIKFVWYSFRQSQNSWFSLLITTSYVVGNARSF